MFYLRKMLVRFLLLTIIMVCTTILFSELHQFDSDILKRIKWREIGPACFGGRIDDIEAVPNNPNIIFIGSASGGIFKSFNNGITWKPVFDEEGISLSIGDIAIAPSDSKIVWAGTGEPNNRQSSSWGNGVYKSVDGGEAWTFMGLEETHHIGRIVIHPRNPDVVYLAALGHLWGSNPERGLYRTKDGGMTWEKILYINDDTGVVDVALEEDGRVIYAAAYQRRRRGWGFIGGGPHSGLYRSLDGGATWEKLSNGLPEGDTGRIGIDISRSHPHIVYAIIENIEGGVFRSKNRGESWTRMSDLNPRPMYYSQIRVDPCNPQKVWVLGTEIFVSLDGGKTFTSEGTGENVHVDHHALWINPNNPDHLLLGGDGGFYISYDGSQNWAFIDNLPLAQYYAICIDTRTPYWIYGGNQDNGTWGIPSRTYSKLGILNSDVVYITHGDGYYTGVDPEDYTMIYAEAHGGRLYRVDLETREEKSIRPVPKNPEEQYRRNWSCPFIISPHDSNSLYYGRNKLLKTTDRGHSWREISPDLTRNQDWRKLPIMGIENREDSLSLDDGIAFYGTITTISESPLQSGLIYIGTDDGKVQMTLNEAYVWQDLTKKFHLPGPRWVSRVLCSQHSKGTAYVSFDGHWDDDFTPYIFKTADFGKSWKMISENIPDGIVVNVVAEHPRAPNLLFAGTEFGLYMSVDGGEKWELIRGNLPRVPIDDIIINARDNDLILGTHGRGIYILDDITMLEKLDKEILGSDIHLFPLREAIQYYEMRELPYQAASKFSGPNPDYGVLFTYYIKDRPTYSREESGKREKAKVIILDEMGNVLRELEGTTDKGFNRISWDLRYPFPIAGAEEFPKWWMLPFKGPFVLPGEYTIKLMAFGHESIQKVKVRIDPRVKARPDALQGRFEASMTVCDIIRASSDGQHAIESMEKDLDLIRKITRSQENFSDEIKTKIKDIFGKLKRLKKPVEDVWKLVELLGQLQNSTSKPTEDQMRVIQHLLSDWERHIGLVNTLLTEEFPELQSQILSQNIQINIPESIRPPKKYKVRK